MEKVPTTVPERSNISFKFTKTVDQNLTVKTQNSQNTQWDLVTSLENRKIKSSLPKKEKKKDLVIPLIKQNQWRIPNNDKSTTETTLDDLAIKEIISESAKANKDWEQRENKEINAIPLLVLNQIPVGYEDENKMDVALRPDEPAVADYENVPVEEYGLAMLRGMGWKPGDPIGNTNMKHVTPVQAAIRPKGLGLGAGQNVANKKQSDKEEELILGKGSYVYIENGQYEGMFGQVEGLDEDNGRVFVKLSSSDEIVSLSELVIRVISQKEFKKESRIINKKKYEEYKTKIEDKFLKPTAGDEESKLEFTESLRCKRLEISRDVEREENKKKRQKSPKSNSEGRESFTTERTIAPWVVPLLRVRFIDKDFKGGKYFNTKMIVEDVLTPTQCLCKTESNHILEDVHTKMLETVIPRTEKSCVMVVQGKHKGQIGVVLNRDKANCIATVQLLSDREKLLKLSYDIICEYLGDVSHFD